MEFEWDPLKMFSNLRKHRVSFRDAVLAFDDPYALKALDLIHSSPGEERFRLLGDADGKVLVIIFTFRKNINRCRIISARIANRDERTVYEFNKRFPVP